MSRPVARWVLAADRPQGIASQVVHLAEEGAAGPICGASSVKWQAEGPPNARRKVCSRCAARRHDFLTLSRGRPYAW